MTACRDKGDLSGVFGTVEKDAGENILRRNVLLAWGVKYFKFLKNSIILMGNCLGCDDPEKKAVILAEYDPLLGSKAVHESVNSVNADHLIECIEHYTQPTMHASRDMYVPPSLSMLRNMTTSQFVAPILEKAEYITVDE